MILVLSVKPKVESHEIQPSVLQSKQPAISPHGWHTLPFKYNPTLHLHILFDKVKLLF